MYIFELIVKYIKGKNYYNRPLKFDPLAEDNLDESSECEHTFMPVDSTGEILACSKCGLVVNRKDLKDINIFKT